ncbi:MAG: hypothetical protein ACJAVK_001866, partial [Akkermansiaceae bacterium]
RLAGAEKTSFTVGMQTFFILISERFFRFSNVFAFKEDFKVKTLKVGLPLIVPNET